MALSCSIKLVNAIVSAEKRETPITDVSGLQLVLIIRIGDLFSSRVFSGSPFFVNKRSLACTSRA